MTTIVATNAQTRDPLIRLPYETWLQCLSLAIYDSADGALPYLAVSPHWNETILSSPALWTKIVINNSEDEEARLHTFLHLSVSQLLEVECARNIPVQLLQLLAQHRMRIRSFLVHFSPNPTTSTQLWSSLGNAKMRRLAVRSREIPDPFSNALIPACPNLRSLETENYIEESMIAATLEEAIVTIQTLANLGALYKCARLHSLTVRRDDTESMPEPEVRNHFLQLSSHLGPRLVNLNIELSLQEFIVFVPYLPSFVALYSATLRVSLQDDDLPTRIAIPIPKQGALNLRMLSLYFRWTHHAGDSTTYRDPVGHILDYFCANQLLRDLHTFGCDSSGIPVESIRMAALLHCLPNANVLHILFGGTETDIASTYAPIHMPNLLELSLRPIAWLARIETPNLIHLDVGSYRFENDPVTPHLSEHFGSKILHLVVDKIMSSAIDNAFSNGVGPRFESLRTLKIAEDLTVEWVVHLPSIRIISFAHPAAPYLLFLDLLRHPGALPNLSTIKFHYTNIICWELLFEVLRRRNMAQMHRIRELVLPGVPILAILSRLVKLLQGHTDVYTNRDIDEVIYQRCNDESFNDDCHYCLFLGYIGCLESLSLDGPGPSPEPFLGKDSPVDLLTLESTKPVDKHRKFQGWGDWETLMNEPLRSAILWPHMRRLNIHCSRFEKRGATISEYTLSDATPPPSRPGLHQQPAYTPSNADASDNDSNVNRFIAISPPVAA